MIPPFVGDPSALVIIDWSWWLNSAFRSQGLGGMTPTVVGRLTQLLAYEPAHLAIALDSPGPTLRHNMQHPTDEAWRYKAGREIKPQEFYDISAHLTALAEEHAIPCLWADGFEADDLIATLAAKAREAGYRVWIITADKDLHQLVESTKADGIIVGTYDTATDERRGPAEVVAKWGVEPRQMADLLALAGDSADNIPGVDGIGEGKAVALLAMFDTLDGALSTAPWTAERFAEVEEAIDALARAAKGPTPPRRAKGAPKVARVPPADAAEILERRKAMLATRAVAKDHIVLLAAADVARFSRDLTALDCDAPIDVPWDDLPLGGYNAPALKRRYHDLGYSQKEAQVSTFPKREPWSRL